LTVFELLEQAAIYPRARTGLRDRWQRRECARCRRL